MPTQVQTIEISADDDGLRLDRWFKRHVPGLAHGKLEKLLRTGQVRLDGRRVKAGARLEKGQKLRLPPLPDEAGDAHAPRKINPTTRERKVLNDSVLFEDDDVLVINKPAGLAVQGGTGLSKHLDGFLAALYHGKTRPKLTHRLDKDTSGVLVLGKNDFATAKLTQAFRERATRKYYWALVYGTPKPKQGKIILPLAKGRYGRMEVDKKEGKHAISLYQIVQSAMRVSFVALWPITGRTHQLRAHLKAIETPIVGDELYAEDKVLHAGDALAVKKLHLHARRLIIPHPRKGMVDVTAPLPPHLIQSWRYFEFPQDDGDPFVDYGDSL